MKSKQVRETFLNFFKEKNHLIVPSAPMVTKNDPTLLFVNSGMAPFKEYFLGNGTPKNNRIADAQKCLRVSGKHNDLEEVGYDTYHHTLFEMLGNWSFGDYFKEDAINWAWELLTEVYKIPKDILYVTIFEGSKEDQLEIDHEAYELWKKLIPEERILKGNKKDNFWEMGDQGPCGPCSEIHVDIRPASEKVKIPGKDLVNKDHPQVVEIWNLVFMQYNRKADGSLEVLPAKHIDTGMGFERLCMVLQGVTSNYDTDVFTPIIASLEKITNLKYTENKKADIAFRVIADHIRAVAFSIADGQLPSNNGAGYVIRRILRRAVRYGFTFLNQKQPFMYQLIDTLVNQMSDAYPELKKQQNLIENVIKEEENSFLSTLEQGLSLLDNLIETAENNILSGKKAFELYDTFGFPIDLTSLILAEKGYTLDEAGFKVELQKQKDRSRQASEMTTDDWVEVTKTNHLNFVGYDVLESPSKIVKYRKTNSKKEGDLYQLVLDTTPFYPEGGGQIGDTGFLISANDKIAIINTKKENNQILHFAKSLPENVTTTFTATVDGKKRLLTSANHTATHLLHQALRKFLGTHVEQKGSFVGPDYLRFDFSHFTKVTAEELQKVEVFVNEKIAEKIQLQEKRDISYDQAIQEGAIALFGEKYGDKVRAIKFGESMELCGGTHVQNTSDIWYFKIKSEGAVAAGIRRIEAITNKAVLQFFEQNNQIIDEVTQLLKTTSNPVKAVESLQEENTTLKKQIEQLLQEKATNLIKEIEANLEDVNNIKFIAQKVDLDATNIKNIAFDLGSKYENLFAVFASSPEPDKAMLTCYISKELVKSKNLDAGAVVRELGKLIQGGGGGQAFFATAGGRNPGGIPKALAKARDFIL